MCERGRGKKALSTMAAESRCRAFYSNFITVWERKSSSGIILSLTHTLNLTVAHIPGAACLGV